MSDIDATFQDLTARFQMNNELYAAFCAVEQRWEAGDPELADETSSDVVRRAWERLSLAQQQEQMQTLFNAYYHSTQAVRTRLRLEEAGADPSKTYLEPGDLDVIDNTFSGAMAMQTFGAAEERSLDKVFPDGMLPIHVDVLQRLIAELELLRHRLDMRDRDQNSSAADDPQ